MRLTNAMRDTVSRRETDKKFEDKLKKANSDLIKEIEKEVQLQHPYPHSMDIVTDGWVSTCTYARIKFPNTTNRSESYFSMNSSFPCKRFTDRFELSPTDKLTKLYSAHEELKAERLKFKNKLSSILYGFNTVKQCVENIPEIKNHFEPEKKAESMVPVPMDQIKEMRKLLKG